MSPDTQALISDFLRKFALALTSIDQQLENGGEISAESQKALHSFIELLPLVTQALYTVPPLSTVSTIVGSISQPPPPVTATPSTTTADQRNRRRFSLETIRDSPILRVNLLDKLREIKVRFEFINNRDSVDWIDIPEHRWYRFLVFLTKAGGNGFKPLCLQAVLRHQEFLDRFDSLRGYCWCENEKTIEEGTMLRCIKVHKGIIATSPVVFSIERPKPSRKKRNTNKRG